MLVKLPHGGLIKLRCPKRRPNGNLYGFHEKMLGRPRGPVWTMKIQRMDSQGALIVFKFIGVSIFFHGKRWISWGKMMKNAVFFWFYQQEMMNMWVLNGFERETHDEHVNFASKLS